jgi:stress-induced morphogen
MAIDAAMIRDRILEALPGADVQVKDLTGGGDHWSAHVVSPAFEGKGPLDRHRMIYAAMGTWMQQEIHALALTTVTPTE